MQCWCDAKPAYWFVYTRDCRSSDPFNIPQYDGHLFCFGFRHHREVGLLSRANRIATTQSELDGVRHRNMFKKQMTLHAHASHGVQGSKSSRNFETQFLTRDQKIMSEPATSCPARCQVSHWHCRLYIRRPTRGVVHSFRLSHKEHDVDHGPRPY